jgi:hypothetical protein
LIYHHLATPAIKMEALVNELIFKRAQQALTAGPPPAPARAMRSRAWCPAAGAALLGLSSTRRWPVMTAAGWAHESLRRVGAVPAWREIVKSALSVSSVITSMEKWSDAITRK